jgi:hypothetical protein
MNVFTRLKAWAALRTLNKTRSVNLAIQNIKLLRARTGQALTKPQSDMIEEQLQQTEAAFIAASEKWLKNAG